MFPATAEVSDLNSSSVRFVFTEVFSLAGLEGLTSGLRNFETGPEIATVGVKVCIGIASREQTGLTGVPRLSGSRATTVAGLSVAAPSVVSTVELLQLQTFVAV